MSESEVTHVIDAQAGLISFYTPESHIVWPGFVHLEESADW